jgi:endo-1,4-beta-mannosidase
MCGAAALVWGRDGFGSDTHEYEFGCHYLPYFISNSDTNTNIIEYEYKMDISNSDSHSNTYSIYSIESSMSTNFICR